MLTIFFVLYIKIFSEPKQQQDEKSMTQHQQQQPQQKRNDDDSKKLKLTKKLTINVN